MSAAPTPGPWHVVRGGRMMGLEIRATNGTDIAKVYDGRLSYGERNANAHRLAAAPELYEALKGMLDQPETSDSYDAMLERALAALEKADGKA
jgi:hypothetical protein